MHALLSLFFVYLIFIGALMSPGPDFLIVVRNALTRSARAGVFAAARLEETDGLNLGHTASAEDIAAHIGEIADWATAKPYGQGGEQNAKFLARLQEKPVIQ